MKRADWVICEHSSRWAAALRISTRPQPRRPRPIPRLREVRSIDELSQHLAEQLCSVALLEVTRNNLPTTLTWISASASIHPHIRCVALLDHEGFDNAAVDDVAAALRAAGAIEICESPRQINRALNIAMDCDLSQSHFVAGGDSSQSITDWAWALLPWQSAE